MNPAITALLTAAVLWVIFIAALHALVLPRLRRPIHRGAFIGLLWHLNRLLCRLVHRVRFSGVEHVPPGPDPGPLIIVSNHTGAVDPLLIQCQLPFFVRWMMAADMMSPAASDLWQTLDVIPVDRDGRDAAAAREAINHVRQGGAVGIFPEGGIVEPRGVIWPFFDGVGLMIARTRAPVLLVWIDGTPETTEMRQSLLTPSRAHVTFIGLLDFSHERDPRAITQALRQRLADVSGWKLVDGKAIPRFAAPAA